MMNVSVPADDTPTSFRIQRGDQPGGLGQADADHHHEHDRHARRSSAKFETNDVNR